jgi:hypothetical protein
MSMDSGSTAFFSKSKSLKGAFIQCLLGAMFSLASEKIFERFGINSEADSWHATDAAGGPEDEYPKLQQDEMHRYLKKVNFDISTVQQRLKPYEHNHIARKVRGSISSKTIQELAKETELPEEVIERMIESLIDYGILYPASRKIPTLARVQRKETPARGTK